MAFLGPPGPPDIVISELILRWFEAVPEKRKRKKKEKRKRNKKETKRKKIKRKKKKEKT